MAAAATKPPVELCKGVNGLEKVVMREVRGSSAEVDKIYLSTPTKIVIIDHEKKRTFVLRKGLPDAVVWNPWDKKAKTMGDFGYNEYKHMLCVEAATVEKPITLKPGDEWKGAQELSAVPSSYCSGQLDPHRGSSWLRHLANGYRYRYRFAIIIAALRVGGWQLTHGYFSFIHSPISSPCCQN